MNIKKKLLGKGGFTLVELVITIAVLVIASAFLVVSYTNVATTKRMESDMQNLGRIDTAINQILMRDDAFEDIKPHLQDTNKLKLCFLLTRENGDDKSRVVIGQAVFGDGYSIKESCPTFYKYLKEYVGSEIFLQSVQYKSGEYVVDVTFNVVKVSDARDPIVTNDVLVITNSGDVLLRP